MSNYAERVEQIKDKYGDRILALLEGIRAAIRATGIEVSEPYDMHCDDFRWQMLAYTESKPGENREGDAQNDIDITFQIAESVQHEGTEDGIQFALDVTTVGGRILGGMSPYNYTSDVWVDVNDDDAVEARFALFEQADPESILDLFPSLTS